MIIFSATGADDTQALQNIVNANPSGVTIRIVGACLCGALSFPANQPYRIEIEGQLTLPTGQTFVVPAGVSLIGIAGGLTAQFSSGGNGARITGSETSNPVVEVVGSSTGKTLENIIIDPPKFVGLKLSGEAALGALVKLRNVSCTARAGVVTSQSFLAEKFFWIDADDCCFQAAAGSYPYSVEFSEGQALGGSAYTGLASFRRLRMNYGGVRFYNDTNQLMGPFRFYEPQIENPATDMFVFDGSTSISDVLVSQPDIFDSTGNRYLLNALQPSVADVRVEGHNYNSPVLNPTSRLISGLKVSGHRRTAYSSPVPKIAPAYARFSQDFMDETGARLIHAPRTISIAPLAVPQNPSLWTPSNGATVVTGILAPDLSLNAGQIGGSNGGHAMLYGNGMTVTLGDWFIIGYWAQSAEADKQPAYARFDLASGGNPWFLNGSSNDTTLAPGQDSDSFNVGDQAWKWACKAGKVTSQGTGTVYPRLYLRRDTLYGLTNYYKPGIYYIPASMGVPDHEVRALARSLTPWSS